jgi:hypothetical protein
LIENDEQCGDAALLLLFVDSNALVAAPWMNPQIATPHIPISDIRQGDLREMGQFLPCSCLVVRQVHLIYRISGTVEVDWQGCEARSVT